MILRILLSYLFYESPISINDCINAKSEALTCLNLMIFINFGQSAGYGKLEGLYGVMAILIDLSLHYAHI